MPSRPENSMTMQAPCGASDKRSASNAEFFFRETLHVSYYVLVTHARTNFVFQAAQDGISVAVEYPIEYESDGLVL